MVSLTKKIFRSINILLVEDNLGDVTLIKEAFKASKRPIQISRVRDGVEAMDYLKCRGRFRNLPKPDLVLLDLNMPKKSGLEVLDEIRADPRLREIPVVVLTNSAANEDFHKAYESKANFYMVKPSDLDQLFVAMRYVENIWLRSLQMEAD